MRFTKEFWAPIAAGEITVAFRSWTKPTVVEGRPYRTGGGRIEVTSVKAIEPADVTDADAVRAGLADAAAVVANLRPEPDRTLFRVEFRVLDEPDPREALAASTDFDDDELAALTARLDRLDAASSHGAWTRETLRLIVANPARRAPDLAEMVGRETKPFKLDVRKLKNLGLTHSLKIGYEPSPRGLAYLDRTESSTS